MVFNVTSLNDNDTILKKYEQKWNKVDDGLVGAAGVGSIFCLNLIISAIALPIMATMMLFHKAAHEYHAHRAIDEENRPLFDTKMGQADIYANPKYMYKEIKYRFEDLTRLQHERSRVVHERYLLTLSGTCKNALFYLIPFIGNVFVEWHYKDEQLKQLGFLTAQIQSLNVQIKTIETEHAKEEQEKQARQTKAQHELQENLRKKDELKFHQLYSEK
jgi:hypothetical protein